MDYKEEQEMEMEALKSIYDEQLTVECTEPYPAFTIDMESQDIKYDTVNGVSVVLRFEFTETYPEELPVMELVQSSDNIMDRTGSILSLMKEKAEESVGMVMIFNVAIAVQELLNVLADENKEMEEAEAERKKQEEEEKERKKFDGTRCTVENFMAWKTEFDREMKEIKRKKGLLAEASTKLSGYELFMTDASLKDSDIKFLDEELGQVEIDDSLFEDLGDLDEELQ